MAEQLAFSRGGDDFKDRAISPLRELGAYEALWDDPKASFKTIADLFKEHPGHLPSDFVPEARALDYGRNAIAILRKSGITTFGVRIHGAGEYPEKLRDARHPIELLYYQGWWELVDTNCFSIVGTRTPSEEGVARAKKLAKYFVQKKYTIVSGLAKGIDTVAHATAIELGGKTIAVIGTPLSTSYPKENASLQKLIAEKYLLISQVPVVRYQKYGPTVNKVFFPERNVTMSALTKGTIIVEAGETSGTLTQARAAINQQRKLFILDSCFRDPKLKWPHRYAEQGAIRVRDFEDIEKNIEP